jgi:glutamate-1-semialdehyde 2,1-aminomutase
MLRFSVSGTEATMHALRIARAYTGKKKIVKFEGHYHGGHDYLLFSTTSSISDLPIKPKSVSPGIPEEISKLILVNEWNDFEGIEKTVKNHHNEIAAIITEPIMGNAAAIQPKKDYLQFLKELCDKYNIVLIFDEVKTGFRVSDGGAQKLFGVKPHLTTLAKAMGNGYPVSVVGGSKEIMQII